MAEPVTELRLRLKSDQAADIHRICGEIQARSPQDVGMTAVGRMIVDLGLRAFKAREQAGHS